ncbi:hypothetical protein [Pseudomonas piscis]|uniref:Uncharacterized protein n=1 Tax=Pseudomonas piscis TaxID=2614538 RepID=A0A7X1U467_9PSED|nr:hypothetical protein [Pseudomonas piscis]MQA53700.1 hypothetical protein [Pseudomonas piscis]
MQLSNKSQLELVAILSAGGSLELSAGSRNQIELIAIATAARAGGANLTLSDLSAKSQLDLLAITKAGKGHVTFRD